MARGNHVDLVKVKRKFGMFIVTPEFSWQSFKYYDSIYVSKSGTLIGKWTSLGTTYRDYIMLRMPKGVELIRRTPSYLFFKI